MLKLAVAAEIAAVQRRKIQRLFGERKQSCLNPSRLLRRPAANRRDQVGTGDRSERIRTYNFPQGRVTEHRIGLTLYKIDAIMDGALDELMDALATADQAEKLKNAQ